MHTHENATIVLILSGEYQESFRGSSSPISPLTVISKPAGEKHANRIGGKGARCLVMEITGQRAREMDGIARSWDTPQVQENGPASRTGLKIVRELRQVDALTPLALESAALEMLVNLARRRPRTYRSEPRWMKEVLELLHGTGEGLRLSSLAAAVGVHPIHLARTFRRTQGCTITHYARTLRLQRVVALLTQDNAPLGEVAVAAGFYDQSHMARVIKRETGLTASEIRSAARPQNRSNGVWVILEID